MLLERKFTDEFDFKESVIQLGYSKKEYVIIDQVDDETLVHYYNSKLNKYDYDTINLIQKPIELKRFILSESKKKTLKQIFEILKEI